MAGRVGTDFRQVAGRLVAGFASVSNSQMTAAGLDGLFTKLRGDLLWMAREYMDRSLRVELAEKAQKDRNKFNFSEAVVDVNELRARLVEAGAIISKGLEFYRSIFSNLAPAEAKERFYEILNVNTDPIGLMQHVREYPPENDSKFLERTISELALIEYARVREKARKDEMKEEKAEAEDALASVREKMLAEMEHRNDGREEETYPLHVKF